MDLSIAFKYTLLTTFALSFIMFIVIMVTFFYFRHSERIVLFVDKLTSIAMTVLVCTFIFLMIIVFMAMEASMPN